MLPVAMACSCSGDVLVCYVLPVLWITSCFPVIGPYWWHIAVAAFYMQCCYWLLPSQQVTRAVGIIALFFWLNLEAIGYNQATRCASQHVWCLSLPSQDKLGGLCQEGHLVQKMVGMAEMGQQLIWMGGNPSRLLVHLPVLCSFCTRKSRRWQNVHSGTSSPALSWTKSREVWNGWECVCVCWLSSYLDVDCGSEWSILHWVQCWILTQSACCSLSIEVLVWICHLDRLSVGQSVGP